MEMGLKMGIQMGARHRVGIGVQAGRGSTNRLDLGLDMG